MDWTDFGAVLSWVVSGGGASMLAYWLMSYVPVLKKLVGEAKRYAAFALAGTIAVGAWAMLTWFGASEWPGTPQAWVTAIFQVIALGIIGSQVVHGRKDLATR